MNLTPLLFAGIGYAIGAIVDGNHHSTAPLFGAIVAGFIGVGL